MQVYHVLNNNYIIFCMNNIQTILTHSSRFFYILHIILYIIMYLSLVSRVQPFRIRLTVYADMTRWLKQHCNNVFIGSFLIFFFQHYAYAYNPFFPCPTKRLMKSVVLLYACESKSAYIQHPTRVKINTVINLACDRAKRMINDPHRLTRDWSQ